MPSSQTVPRALLSNAGLNAFYSQQQALANAASGQVAFVRPTAFMPQFQPPVVPNQYPQTQLYPGFALHQAPAGINLGTGPTMQLQSQNIPTPGGIVVSQASYLPPPTTTKQITPSKKQSKAIKIVDPSTGDVVKVDKPQSDAPSVSLPSATNPTTGSGGGLLPEPKPVLSKPDVAQDFKTKVQSTMNTSSPVFVPGQPLRQDYRPNAIIRFPEPITKPPPPENLEKVPVINGKAKEDDVIPTTPLEPPPPPTQTLEENVPPVEEPTKELPSTVVLEEQSPPISQGTLHCLGWFTI